jgi:iron complex outermembrane recepter protein
MNRGFRLRLACSFMALAFAGPLHAQSAANNPENEDSGSTGDIVVTALKRSESLQRVPAAVSVIDNARLTELGVSNLAQITNLSTGVAVAPIRSRANLYIRGVGQALASPNADSNVALNLNGVYLIQSMAGTAFFDVDRVEILPGPQGTLYGRNSTGGVVNITSRRPGNEYAADGFLEAGNHGHYHGMLGIDIPLTDTLSSRFAVTHNRHDGYINNGTDDQKSTAVRQTLVWRPGATTTITLVGTYTHEGGIGNTLMNVPDLDCGFRCANFDPNALGFYYRVNIFQGTVQVDHEIGDNATLTYIGGYSDLDQEFFGGLVYGPPVIPLLNPESAEVHSHELRLNARFARLEGIVGAYYFHEESSVGTILSPTPAVRLDNPFTTKAHGAAVYGQGTYSLADSFRVTAGLRYSNNVKSIDGSNSAFSNATGATLFRRPYTGRVSMNRVDWRAGFEYDVGSNSLVYASVASGFTPGGFSTGPQVIGQLAAKPFEPVKLIAYAGGIKNRFADGKLTLNLEGFYYDYKNYQISARDLVTSQNLVYNAAKSTVYGVQLDSRLKLGRNDDLSVNATYLHAKADRLLTPSGNFSGLDLPFSPRWTINAFYEHAFDVGNDAQIRANVNFKYTSGRWTIYTHAAPGFFQKGNTHTDLNLGYFAADNRWSIQAYIRNLEDRLVKTACVAGIPGPAACYFEPPRTYGVQLGFKF